MRVLHVISGRRLYPQARQAIEIVKELRRCGIQAHVACEPECAISIAAEATLTPVAHWPMTTKSGLRKLGRLWRLISSVNADLVHVHCETGDATIPGLAARLVGVRCVLSSDAPDRNTELPRPLAQRLYDRYLTTSIDTAKRLLTQGVPESRLCRVRIGVDPQKYQPSWTPQEFLRAFDLSEDEFTIGLRVDDLSRKELKQLAHLLPILTAIYAGMRLLIFGEGPSVDYLRRRLNQVKLGEVVRYAGYRAEWLGFLGHLDLFLNLQRDVRQSMHVLDAQAAGVSVAGFDIVKGAGLVAECNRENLVAAQDYDKLASVVRRLIFRPKLRQELTARASRWIGTEFSPADMALSYFEAYAPLIDHGSRSTVSSYKAA